MSVWWGECECVMSASASVWWGECECVKIKFEWAPDRGKQVWMGWVRGERESALRVRCMQPLTMPSSNQSIWRSRYLPKVMTSVSVRLSGHVIMYPNPAYAVPSPQPLLPPRLWLMQNIDRVVILPHNEHVSNLRNTHLITQTRLTRDLPSGKF